MKLSTLLVSLIQNYSWFSTSGSDLLIVIFKMSLDVLQVCRGLMIASIVVGFAAIFITILGLKCVTIGGKNAAIKARVALAGGFMFGLTGMQSFCTNLHLFSSVVPSLSTCHEKAMVALYFGRIHTCLAVTHLRVSG